MDITATQVGIDWFVTQDGQKLAGPFVVMAQVCWRSHMITKEEHTRLFDAGLMLRTLAGLPMPWDDPEP